MEGITAILLLLIIVALIFVIKTNNKVAELSNDLSQVKKYLKALRESIDEKIIDKNKEVVVEKPRFQEPVYSAKSVVAEERPIVENPVHTKEEFKTTLPTEKIVESVDEKTDLPIAAIVEVKVVEPVQHKFIPKEIKKTDFEQFIGEKLISLVGIAILVLGIFFSVKWAIDKKLISDAGKVLIGLVSGSILIGVAHKLQKNYRAFSSILVGGGIAVFYFSIYEAYEAYHLLPQTGAFVAMVLVTIAAIILSVIYDKKELAIIAIVGGFSTPFLVSNGSGNYQVLFSYLLILNIGMFCLAYFKKWNLVNIISYAFTVLIFGGWIAKNSVDGNINAQGGFLFATLFYLTFFGMNIIYNIRRNEQFKSLEIGLLLSNTFFYFGVGLYFLHSINNGNQQGFFTIALSVFNFIFAYIFYKQNKVDKNLIYLLIALVLTFLSLTGPIQLKGNYITLFWACEFVLLYWLATKSKIELIKNTSMVIVVLAIISLILDWHNNYYSVQINKLPIVINKSFIVGSVVLSAIYLKINLVKKDSATNLLWNTIDKSKYVHFLQILFVVVLYAAGIMELNYQSFHCTRIYEYRNLMMWLYQYVFIAILLFIQLRKKSNVELKIGSGIASLLLLFYPIANLYIAKMRLVYLNENQFGGLFAWHYLIPIVALAIVYLLVKFISTNYDSSHTVFKLGAWFLTAVVVYILSSEIVQIWVTVTHQQGFDWRGNRQHAVKVALPILWSIISLMLMLIGMRKKIKLFRIISLSLFSLTIIKLFLYDISNMGQGGKIAAFIILGVILLLVSFMYQKIKGLFIDEKDNQISE